MKNDKVDKGNDLFLDVSIELLIMWCLEPTSLDFFSLLGIFVVYSRVY